MRQTTEIVHYLDLLNKSGTISLLHKNRSIKTHLHCTPESQANKSRIFV